MNEDYLYLSGAYLIYTITLIWLSKVSINFWRTFFMNFWTLLVYSVFIAFNLIYNSQGGLAIAWFVLWLCSIGLHWLINLATALKRFNKQQ